MTSYPKKYKPHWQRRRERQIFFRLALTLLFILLFIFQLTRLFHHKSADSAAPTAETVESSEILTGIEALRPDLDVELLDINPYSRPGIALDQVNGIVIHYTANPGSSAMANRDYFNGLAQSHTTKASSHFVIGLEGEIVQCIPCNEIAYASNSRNHDTIAIECCIPDDSGAFNDATYDSMVRLTAWLMVRYHLTTDDVIRHYDITGKDCPKYYVEHEDAWEQFKEDVAAEGDRLEEELEEQEKASEEDTTEEDTEL